MKSKIEGELAIGMILIIAIIMAGIFLLQEKKQNLKDELFARNSYTHVNLQARRTADAGTKETEDTKADIPDCPRHYYEGEATIRGWLLSSANDENLTVQIKNEDIEKLPTTKADSMRDKFMVTLIDPTDDVKEKLKTATEEKPVQITIRGFAHVCKTWPQASLKQATIAFKKNS